MNIASGHSKGHQNSSGKVFQTGEFYSTFDHNPDPEKQDFIKLVYTQLSKLIELLGKDPAPPGEAADTEVRRVAKIHKGQTLSKTWSLGQGNTAPRSHTTCFCCLTSTPEHALCCGHLICRPCLENYSYLSDDKFYRCLKVCPLCGEKGGRGEIVVRPRTAGLRVLSLDG